MAGSAAEGANAGASASASGSLEPIGPGAGPGARPRGELVGRRSTFIRVARRRPLMTVRDKVGRTRYLAFRLEGGPLSRPALSGALPATAKLTRFDGEFGILRTSHRDQAALREVLMSPRAVASKEVRLVTLATSGTIRGAARSLPPTSEASRRSPSRRD